MAGKKIVTVGIESQFNSKGIEDAKKGLRQVEVSTQKAEGSVRSYSTTATTGFERVAKKIAGLGLAIQGARSVLSFFSESITAANKNARAVNTLAAAYNAVGYTASGALEQAKKFASEMQNLTGIADEVFLDGQRLLANYGIVGTKAQEAIRAAYALSVGKSMELTAALDLVTKASVGQTSALSRYGIVLDSSVKEGEKFDAVLKQINERFGATAQATLGDTTTKINALKESWGDLKEQIGAGLNDGLVPIVNLLTTAVGWLNKGFKAAGAAVDVWLSRMMLAFQGAKAGILSLGALALNALSPVAKLMSYLPGIGKDIENIFNQAKASLTQMAASNIKQTAILADMLPPVSSIWQTEKDITDEQQKQLDLQAEEINNRKQILDLTQEQMAADKAASEQRQQNATDENTDEAKQEQDKYGLKKALGLEELKDKKTVTESITKMLRQGSKEQMAVQKAQGIAQAAISSYQAANAAYSALAGIPIVGPALGAAAAAAALAYGLNNVAQISGIKLADGGLVKAVTGGVPAVVGEGGSDEAVLPLDNARAMQRIGGAIAEQGGAVGGQVVLTQNITVQAGESLIPDITNALRNATVDALEMANLTVKVGQEQQGLSV